MHADTSSTLMLRYRTSTAQVLDTNRKFLDASFRYYELSQTQMAGEEHIDQHELMELLARAITCAILGKAGPQKSRILSILHKDERVRSLERIEGYSNHGQVGTKVSSVSWCLVKFYCYYNPALSLAGAYTPYCSHSHYLFWLAPTTT